MSKSCPEELPFNLSTVSLLRSDRSNIILKWTFKGEFVAVKKLLFNLNSYKDQPSLQSHWEKLVQLRDEHLIQYLLLSNIQEDDVRYLVPVTDLCRGSMMDYCRGTLDKSFASLVKSTDVMWQITCGLDYLHRHKIDPGNLKLKNVLFWKTNSKSRQVVVKISGYGYSYHRCKEKIINIAPLLGRLFYSVATKAETGPNGSISLHSLTEIDANHRVPAFDLISLLINGSLSNSVDAGTLLRHPLFTRYTDEGKFRLFRDLMDDKVDLIWNDTEKLENWLEFLDEKMFPDEDFDEFKDIFLEGETKYSAIRKALKTPQLFFEYIWHIATESDGNNKPNSIKLKTKLGEGNYGTVFQCEYTDGNGSTYLAACKKCKPESDNKVFNREIENLRKLNHLFVVKYLDVVTIISEKFIVLELCEGSLKDYLLGNLKHIPKDSLDEKIIISQVALGLAFIHDKGIIHNDVKLDNILLKRQSDRLVLAKIADFGFAKELKPGKSEFSQTKHPGTENYMAPELLKAKNGDYPVSFASDVYALGITIARIVLKGKNPFSDYYHFTNISMVMGLTPQNLQGLSWELIDLIRKLTDKDPGKRPKMALVLLHPYFVLTNDRTLNHFVDRLWDGLKLLFRDDRSKEKIYYEKIFSNQNFKEWYDSVSDEVPITEKEKEEMENTLRSFKKLQPDITSDDLFPDKEYVHIIKEGISFEYDAIKNYVKEINSLFYSCLSRYRLYKLIQRAPKFLVPYLSSHLIDVFKEPIINTKAQNNPLLKTYSHRNKDLESTKSSVKQHRLEIVSELEWSSTYYDDQELIDDIWNSKYAGKNEYSKETVKEIIRTLEKCMVSEKIWSSLLNRNEIDFTVLILAVVRSHSSNAPKVTEMILQRKQLIKEIMPHLVVLVASNEGNWAAEIMQVLLENWLKPGVKHPLGPIIRIISAHLNKMGITSIHWAAQNESSSGPKLMKLLLEKGWDPNIHIKNRYRFTPVYLAAANQGDYAADILKLLLDNGSKYETQESELIHTAMLNNGESALQLLDLLLKRCTNINVIHKHTGMSLVHFAIMSQKGNSGLKMLKNILEKGADPNSCTFSAITPVHLAAISNGEAAHKYLKILLENGGDANAIDKDGATPLCYAAIISSESNIQRKKIIKTLLDHGGNPNYVHRGKLLVQASFLKNESSVALTNLELLLRNGGNPNIIDSTDLCLIHYAAESVSETAPEKMKILLECGGDVNASGKNGLTPIHSVAMNSGIHAPKLLKILLEHGGDPRVNNCLKQTPLHWVAINENDQVSLDITNQLLEKGGNPNAADFIGWTPVHYGISSAKTIGKLSMVKLLLEHGGNILQEDKFEFTPYHISIRIGSEHCHPEVKKHIEKTLRELIFRACCAHINATSRQENVNQ